MLKIVMCKYNLLLFYIFKILQKKKKHLNIFVNIFATRFNKKKLLLFIHGVGYYNFN